MVGTVVVNTPVGKNIERHEVTYHVEADVTNFSAERFVRGHKAEAQAMRVVANAQGIQARGDMRIGGAPAFVEYRKPVGVGDAEVRLQTTLDDSSRARFGLDTAGLLSGPVPVRLSGRIGSGDNESRFQVELDLLHARIVELMPGWNKPAGKATRASVVIVERPHSLRFEDVAIEGAGTSIRGRSNSTPTVRSSPRIFRCLHYPTATRPRCGPSAPRTGRCAFRCAGMCSTGAAS